MAGYNGAVQFVLQAVLWSPDTHELFSFAARARALQLLMLSYHMLHSGVVPIPVDVWVMDIIPRVLSVEL